MPKWCPPCKMLNPVLQKVFENEQGADLMKINTDNVQEVAAKYKVRPVSRSLIL